MAYSGGSGLPYIGLIVIATSIAPVAAGAYGLYRFAVYGEEAELAPAVSMLEYGVALALVGFMISRAFRPKTLKPVEAIALTVLAWILIPVIGSVPFKTASGIPWVDALFESVSGWTTTGLTVLTGEESPAGGYVPRVEELPRTLQAWRTVMQWVGGLGIVVFTLGILARPGISAAALYIAEGRSEKIEASVRATAARMLSIYIILTGIAASAFILSGLNLYDAVSHAMTGVATAGFSTRDASIGYWLGSPPVLLAAMLAMYLGAVNFRDHNAILNLRFGRLRESVETKAQLAIILAASAAGLAIWARDPGMRETFTPLQTVFHVVSASATAGFQAGDLSQASDSYKALLAVLSLVGGSAFSTAGGMKVIRIVIAMKAAAVESEVILHPRGYRPRLTLGPYVMDEVLLRRVLAVLASMTLAYAAMTITLSAAYPQYGLADAGFEVASAMGNVGLSVGVTAASAPTGVKALLMAAMLLGRLEVVAYIIALRYLASRLRGR